MTKLLPYFFPPENPVYLWFVQFLLQQVPSENRRAVFLQDMAYANCSLNGFPCPSCWIPQSSSCYFFSNDKASATVTRRLFHKNERSCVIIISEHWVILLGISRRQLLGCGCGNKAREKEKEEGLFDVMSLQYALFFIFYFFVLSPYFFCF